MNDNYTETEMGRELLRVTATVSKMDDAQSKLTKSALDCAYTQGYADGLTSALQTMTRKTTEEQTQ